jgi:hypothetical protein
VDRRSVYGQNAVMRMAVTGMDASATLALVVLVVLIAALSGTMDLVIGRRERHGVATPEQRATHDLSCNEVDFRLSGARRCTN